MNTFECTYSIDDIDGVAKALLQQFNTKTILFEGGMGAGKTTLIGALLKAMDSDDAVSSPTFSIVNTYTTANRDVHHFDFYRIESIEEALDIGVEDYFYDDAWLFIEWPSRIETLIPESNNTIIISFDEDLEKRHLQLIKPQKLNSELI